MSLVTWSCTFQADKKDHRRLSYHVGDSMRRLWVKRATYTSEEWVCPFRLSLPVADIQTIIPEHKLVSATDEANHFSSPLIDLCRNHPTLLNLSDVPNLAASPLPPTIDLYNLPQQYWPNPSHTPQPPWTSRKPLKSQDHVFDASGFKSTRN
jgi:hypothetical protein